jgi:hypothetical protein
VSQLFGAGQHKEISREGEVSMKSGSQWDENFSSVLRDKEQAEKMLATTGSKLVLN